MKTPRSLGAVVSPTLIVAVVLLAYLGLILARSGGDPLAFVVLGAGFQNGQPIGEQGYDGQFSYFIALDPRLSAVAEHLDVPAYRYQRLLYPLLARLLALGLPAALPWTLILVNLAAQIAGTALVERWLTAHGMSRWYALTYGLWAGLLMAVRLDLNEPLCYALTAGALLAQRRGRAGLSALLIGLALFAKETALLFWLSLLASAALTLSPGHLVTLSPGRPATPSPATRHSSPVTPSPRHLVTLSLSIVPFALFQFWLRDQFGAFGLTSGGYLGTPFEWIPFTGLWRIGAVSLPGLGLYLAMFSPFVVFPSLWGIAASLRRFWQRDFTPAVLALSANALFIPFTPFSTFREPLGLIRLMTGLVLATVLYGAHSRSKRVLNYSLFWIAAAVFLLKE